MTPNANKVNPTANKVMKAPHRMNNIAHNVGLRWVNDTMRVRMS